MIYDEKLKLKVRCSWKIHFQLQQQTTFFPFNINLWAFLKEKASYKKKVLNINWLENSDKTQDFRSETILVYQWARSNRAVNNINTHNI